MLREGTDARFVASALEVSLQNKHAADAMGLWLEAKGDAYLRKTTLYILTQWVGPWERAQARGKNVTAAAKKPAAKKPAAKKPAAKKPAAKKPAAKKPAATKPAKKPTRRGASK